MKKKVIVPLDGSRTAEQMLPWIRTLAIRLDLTVCLLQVLDPAVYGHPETGEGDETRRASRWTAERYLVALADDLRLAGVRAYTVVEYGDPIDGILFGATQERADFIAMSTHGRSGVSRWLYGSVAEGVLRAARVPVLLYRAELPTPPATAVAQQSKHVLVPLDGSETSEQVLPALVQLLKDMEMEVILLGVVQPPEAPTTHEGVVVTYVDARVERYRDEALAYLSRYARYLREQGLAAQTRVEIGRPSEWILLEAKQSDAAFIAMATHARAGLDRALHGSVADEVMRRSSVPVLLVRAEPAPVRTVAENTTTVI